MTGVSYRAWGLVFDLAAVVGFSFRPIKRIGANHFALIGGVSPVVTVFAAAIGLEEPVTSLQVAGSILVISGVLLVSLKPKNS